MMPYALLHHLAHLLKQQNKITIRHHQNLLSLDTPHYLFKALMQQAQSYVYVDTTRLSVAKTPFNLALEKYASNAKILDAFLENEDRILKIALECPHAYKKIRSYLQLEFTGKHSNAILLDMQNKVIEALHFVRETQSYRPVLKNQVLLALQKPHFKRPPLEPLSTPDFLQDLQDLHHAHSAKLLSTKKSNLEGLWLKKKQNLQAVLQGLPSEAHLSSLAQQKHTQASLILSNLHRLDPKAIYSPVLKLENEGIELPKNARCLSDAANKLFRESKKCKQKSAHVALQRDNLTSKIAFLDAKLALLEHASLEELNLLTPLKNTAKKKTPPARFENFEIEGVKVLIGRNEKENRELLKMARSQDIWAHIQDKPSAHMLIFTHPNKPSSSLLLKACTLLAKLSYPHTNSQQSLKVRIDYTPKKHVKFASKPNNRAYVTYTHFSSLSVGI